jgi:hypothetical protein
VKTHENYARNAQQYHALVEKNKASPRQRGAVVLDLFAGIGSGEVALKRLGISVDKVSLGRCDRMRMLLERLTMSIV